VLLAQAVPHHGQVLAVLAGVDLDVVAHRVGREQAEHRLRLQPLLGDDLVEHGLAVGKDVARGLAHHRVVQDGGEAAGEVPGLEERAPVDVVHQLAELDVDRLHAEHVRPRRLVGRVARLVVRFDTVTIYQQMAFF